MTLCSGSINIRCRVAVKAEEPRLSYRLRLHEALLYLKHPPPRQRTLIRWTWMGMLRIGAQGLTFSTSHRTAVFLPASKPEGSSSIPFRTPQGRVVTLMRPAWDLPALMGGLTAVQSARTQGDHKSFGPGSMRASSLHACCRCAFCLHGTVANMTERVIVGLPN